MWHAAAYLVLVAWVPHSGRRTCGSGVWAMAARTAGATAAPMPADRLANSRRRPSSMRAGSCCAKAWRFDHAAVGWDIIRVH